mgnify:CR=1 FL=1|jgi:Nucleotidyltransferase/DNA polymerase involved in DNA repair
MERVIMLIDCQSFYASVEKAAHPEYKNLPVVVAGVQALFLQLALLRRSTASRLPRPLAKRLANVRSLSSLDPACRHILTSRL